MPPIYDDNEAFAAGDEDQPQFDNAKLLAIMAVVRALADDDKQFNLIRLAILVAIFGEAEDR